MVMNSLTEDDDNKKVNNDTEKYKEEDGVC